MISYKYNIYYSKKTKYLEKMLRECCFVWNHALALQRRYYKLFGKYIPVGKMQKHFSKRINRNLLHSQTTQEVIQRLDSAYNRFFKKLAKRAPMPVRTVKVRRSVPSNQGDDSSILHEIAQKSRIILISFFNLRYPYNESQIRLRFINMRNKIILF